jgi:hypothetical protein
LVEFGLRQNKKSYEEFKKSGEEFKDAIFKMCKRIISEEEFPKRFEDTTLLPSSAQAPAKFSWAELALILFPPAPGRPPGRPAARPE